MEGDAGEEEEAVKAAGKWAVLYLSCTRADVVSESKSFQTIYRPWREREIKIIGATNTLEAGATLPNLCAVIDCARQLTRVIYPLQRREQMISLPIPETSRVQRRGRVGRTGPGQYIGLFAALTRLRPSAPPSTLVGTSVPSSIYTMLMARTFEQYSEIVGDPLAIARLVCLRRIGCRLPITDVIRDLQLLTPVSMDSAIRFMARLTSLGLIEWDGSLTVDGLLAAGSHRGTSIGEALLRLRLLPELIHPLDVELLVATVIEAVARAELANEVEWKHTISRFYSHITFTFRDRPPQLADIIAVIRTVFDCFTFISSPATAATAATAAATAASERRSGVIPQPQPHPKWGSFSVGEAKVAMYRALELYHSSAISSAGDSSSIAAASVEVRGAFFAPMYANANSADRSRIIAIIDRALSDVAARIAGREVEMPSEELGVTLL